MYPQKLQKKKKDFSEPPPWSMRMQLLCWISRATICSFIFALLFSLKQGQKRTSNLFFPQNQNHKNPKHQNQYEIRKETRSLKGRNVCCGAKSCCRFPFIPYVQCLSRTNTTNPRNEMLRERTKISYQHITKVNKENLTKLFHPSYFHKKKKEKPKFSPFFFLNLWNILQILFEISHLQKMFQKQNSTTKPLKKTETKIFSKEKIGEREKWIFLHKLKRNLYKKTIKKLFTIWFSEVLNNSMYFFNLEDNPKYRPLYQKTLTRLIKDTFYPKG